MIGIGFLILAIVLFLILVSIGSFVSSYNTFVSLRQDIRTQFSNIVTEYQRRTDMFYNLVQTVKSFKKHENKTLTEVVAARNLNFGQSKKQDMKNMKQLDGLFSKLMAVVEAYPNLKSDEQHNKLMDEIRITEDRINVSRTDYNNIVNTYNTRVKSFPSNIVAGMFNFDLEAYFEGQAGVEKAPQIDLE